MMRNFAWGFRVAVLPAALLMLTTHGAAQGTHGASLQVHGASDPAPNRLTTASARPASGELTLVVFPQRRHSPSLDASLELGALSVLQHSIQFGRDGTRFNYVEQGGQDVLFPFWRLSGDLGLGRHHVVFLYQPLELNTQVVLERDVRVDGEDFAAGSALDLRYGFPFYRVSYLYDVLPRPNHELGLGGSLQIRNATISFTAADGDARRTNRDVGPVPALKARWRYQHRSGWFGGAEVDGFYAPIKYLNGGDSDVEGAIIDASLRAGYTAGDGMAGFVNLRWLGGGAQGSSEPEQFSDGYTRNWLNFLIVSVGVQASLF